MKVAFTCLFAHTPHAVSQIVLVAVKKAFLLDEVNKHQAVEHQRGIPGLIGGRRDARDEVGKGLMLGLEMLIEFLGNTVTVKGFTQARDDIGEGDGLFFFQCPDNLVELLPQRLAAGALVLGVGARGVGLAGYAGDPQPGERGLCRIGENQQVLVGELGGFFLDFKQRGARRDVAAGIGRATENRNTAFLRDGGQGKGFATDGNLLRFEARVIPAEFVEKLLQFEVVEQLVETGGINCHGRLIR